MKTTLPLISSIISVTALAIPGTTVPDVGPPAISIGSTPEPQAYCLWTVGDARFQYVAAGSKAVIEGVNVTCQVDTQNGVKAKCGLGQGVPGSIASSATTPYQTMCEYQSAVAVAAPQPKCTFIVKSTEEDVPMGGSATVAGIKVKCDKFIGIDNAVQAVCALQPKQVGALVPSFTPQGSVCEFYSA